MAIDPNIALDYQPMQVDVGHDIKTAMAINNIQADTQGKLIANQVAQRNLDIQKWAGQNASKYVGTDPQGNPKFDVVQAASDAAQAGYADAIPHIAQEYIDNQKGQIANSSSQIDQQTKLFQAGKDVSGMAGVHVLSVPVDQRVTDYNKIRDTAIKQFGPQISSFFPDTNRTEDVTQWAQSATKTTMTPMQAQELQNSTTYANIASKGQIASGGDAARLAADNADLANRFNIGADAIVNLPPGLGAATQDPSQWTSYLANLNPSQAAYAAQVKQALDLHKSAGRPDLPMNVGSNEAIAGILRTDSAYQTTQSGINTKKASVQGFTAPAAAAPADKTSSPTTVRMVSPSGKFVRIPEDKVKDATINGYKRAQ